MNLRNFAIWGVILNTLGITIGIIAAGILYSLWKTRGEGSEGHTS